MNQNFNDMIDGLKHDNAERKSSEPNTHYRTYETAGHVRNLSLGWPNGTRRFFNYAYLVSGELRDDKKAMSLVFTSETILIKGLRLGLLYNDLLSHLPLEVIVIEERYSGTVDDKTFIVTNIEIVDNNRK